jgi:hypothetical protein
MMASLFLNWKNITMGGLALVAAAMYGLWQHERAVNANDRAAQAQAIIDAQTKADALAKSLEEEQARKAEVVERTVTQYVDRIRKAPDDRERLRATASGMRAILESGSSKTR